MITYFVNLLHWLFKDVIVMMKNPNVKTVLNAFENKQFIVHKNVTTSNNRLN